MRNLLKWGLTASLTGTALLLLDALFFEKYFFEVKRFRIGRGKGCKSIKLLLLTDLHMKRQYRPYYDKLAKKINEINPDLMLIAGDTLDGNTSEQVVHTFFGSLHDHIPKVAIPGNHDYLDEMPIRKLEHIYQQHNCRLLINKTTYLEIKGERMAITGLDDFIESSSCFFEAVEHVGYEQHHFLLIHSPLQQESVLARMQEINEQRSAGERLNISYIFAGHNHGGQVRFAGLVPKLPLMSGSYVNGWYNKQPPFLYLSRGFGTSTLPFRFGSRSEITLFDYVV